jgi:dihydrofolate reductase
MAQGNGRTVVGNISLSLDGRATGPGGVDMGWVATHAVSDAVRAHLARLTSTVTTVLLGRKNYEGFGGYWPTVARDANADPRDRAFAQWLDDVEKVAFSTKLRDAPWSNSRIVDADPASVVRELRRQDGGDILAMSSGSIIRALLDAGELDRLAIVLCPELVGGGTRFFPDGLASSSWNLTDLATTDTGALCLRYDRVGKDG